jgi:hypothetical protein
MTHAHIVSIEPTCFFVRDGDQLRQLVRVTVAHVAAEHPLTLRVRCEAYSEETPLSSPTAGPVTYERYLPDLRRPLPVTFQLAAGAEVQDEQTVRWQPQTHWEVHLVHYIHHDLGYTDIPSNVLREYDGHMDDVLRYCVETEEWPEADARFRFQCEQTWSLLNWLERRPPNVVERLLHFVKNGQIEVTALFGNMTLELCGHEELIRLLYPAFALKRRYGIPITSAEHNDIPGFAWGLASVLAGAGIRYFSPGVPLWYFGEGDDQVHPLWDTEAALPLDIPAACWWEGPDRARVLLWSDLHGREWQPYNYDQAVQELPAMLRYLEEQAYPYDLVSYTVRGGHRDNAPPTLIFAYLTREWNRRWAYPRLINTTNTPFLQEFERRWGHTLKTLRGDVPGTDYGVAATCTPKETAISRNTHDALVTAETLATLAAVVADYSYPKATLDEAYRQLFYYDEHCWGLAHVGGPAHDAHWTEKSNFAYRAAALTHDVTVKAANKIVDGIDFPEEGWYLTVFNSLSYERSDIVRAPLRAWSPASSPMFWQAPNESHPWPELRSGRALGRRIIEPPADLLAQPFQLFDMSNGEPVAYQIARVTDPQAATPWAAERVALGKVEPRHEYELVLVANLPPLGYKSYRLVPSRTWPRFATPSEPVDGVVENEFFKLVLDSADGLLASLVDKGLGQELIDSAAPHRLGQLIIRSCETGVEEVVRLGAPVLAGHGPICTTVRLKGGASSCPRVTAEVVLYHTVKRIDLNLRILRDSTPLTELFVAFPFAVANPRFRYEATNAVIEPLRDGWPGSNSDYYAVQHWVQVSNEERGVVWTPLDTPMAELGGLWPGYLSAAHHGVRGPGYGHPFLQPRALAQGHIYALVSYNNFRTNFFNVQPGEFLIRYAFSSYGSAHPGQTDRFGWNAANPPLAVWMEGPQRGRLPTTNSFCQLDAPNVSVLACKRAEDGDGLILRLREMEGKETTARLTVPSLPVGHVYEASLVEENLRLLSCQDDAVLIWLRPHAIVTLRLTLKVGA